MRAVEEYKGRTGRTRRACLYTCPINIIKGTSKGVPGKREIVENA
jgi:hypothetical protein